MSQFWINLRGLFVCWGFMRQNLLGFWKNRLGSLGGWKTSGVFFKHFDMNADNDPNEPIGLSLKFFLSAAEICSSLKESSSKQSKEMFLSFLFLQSCQSVCLKWFRKLISSIPAGVHLYCTRFRSSFIWIRSRSFRLLIWTPTSRLCSFWKSKVFSSFFLFITYSQSPLTFYLRCPLLKYFLSFSFPWGEMKSVPSQWEAALLCVDVKISECMHVTRVEGVGG